MRIVNKDLKHGVVKVSVASLDDMWFLSQLVEAGDIVRGKAERKVKMGDGGEKARSAKKVFTAEIKVETVAYEATHGSLRINGTMESEHEHAPAGSHQSINIEPGDQIGIKKEEWMAYHLERLEEAANASDNKVIIAVHDREEAFIAKMRSSGYEMLTHISGQVTKKSEPGQVGEDFYSELSTVLAGYNDRLKPSAIVVASPAFFSEDFLKSVKDEALKKKIVKATCSSVSKNAIDEVMRRDEVKGVLSDQSLARETKAVDDLLERIAKKGNAAYGIKEVKTAVEAGAAETLLVTDGFITDSREKEKGGETDNLLKQAAKGRSTIVIISSGNEPGGKLDGLGGIGALLRYSLS